jgi:hypothetical protein
MCGNVGIHTNIIFPIPLYLGSFDINYIIF